MRGPPGQGPRGGAAMRGPMGRGDYGKQFQGTSINLPMPIPMFFNEKMSLVCLLVK